MQDVQDRLKKAKLSIKEFTRQLAPFMNIEWNDSWYQHIYRVVKGEVEPTEEEADAIDAWILSFDEPHVSGARAYKVSKIESSIDLMKRYLQTGIYNPTQINNLFKKINSAIRS